MAEYSYDAEQEKLRRRRMLAQAISAGGQMPQGQMVGRHYVAPSPWTQLASVGQQLAGAYMDRKTNQQEDALKERERSRLADALRNLGVNPINGTAGTDKSTSPGGPDPGGSGPNIPQMPTEPTTQPVPPQRPNQSIDPRREAALAVLRDLPIEAQQQILGQQAMAQLFPKQVELKQVDLGNEIGFTDATGNVVRRIPKGAAPQGLTDDQREYDAAVKSGTFKGSLQDWIIQGKKAGATTVSTNVNTEKSLYGGLADERAKGLSALYQSAQAAPMTIERADRVKQLLKTVPYTGAAADWKLAVGKAAKAAGFDYAGDDIANTELLARELGQNVLDSVKTSGLAGSQGLTEGERKFLLQVVGGTIALDDKTIGRVADLNQRMAKNTMQRWNAEAGRLDPNQLRTLGMTTIEMPPDTPASGAQPKLIKNPDGSYTYTP